MTTVGVLGLWGVFLTLAAVSRIGRREGGLTPAQCWITRHRLAYSVIMGGLTGAGLALATSNPWFALAGLGVTAASWAAVPRAEARLRRRFT